MFDWLLHWFKGFEFSWRTGLVSLLVGLFLFVACNIVVIWMLVKLPATYFLDEAHPSPIRHPVLRWTLLIGKNLLGIAMVLSGVVLSLPAIPGPGFFLIFFGITLLNFPGKRRLERNLVSRPMVLRGINRLRHRHGKPPLVLDTQSSGPSTEGRLES